MCLDKVRESYDSPSNLVLDGWKVFRGSGSKLEFENLSQYNPVHLDEWMKASESTIRANDGNSYESGFHVYEDETKTHNNPTKRRVFIRKVTCRGEQGGHPIAIAQEMYVPSDENDWPPKPGEPDKKEAKKESLFDRVKKSVKPGDA